VNKNTTIGEKYGPAMEITGQAKADAYFEKLVNLHMAKWGKSREEAEALERGNLGYYAGYYSAETRERVERLFKCSHPVFGEISKNGQPHALRAKALGIQEAGRVMGFLPTVSE
jgi:hypothetical protein